MKFEKVVYIRYIPLTKAIYTDLYFDELIQNNIQVDYLDVTDLFYSNKITTDSFDFAGTVKITSYKQIKDYLKKQNNSNTLYISIMTFEGRVFKLFRLFTKFNLTLGVFARGVFPNGTETDKKTKVSKILKIFSFVRVATFLGNKITLVAKKYGFIKPYDYIFKAGEFGYYGLGMGSEIDIQKSKIIEVNTVDYDRFVLHKQLPSLREEEYIVFLDQYLPYHPDASYFGLKTVEPEPYFKEINGFFDRLEQATGKKVVIAAHPKAKRYNEFNPYNGRAIFFNKSNDLVKEASLILTHASTAVCFPICYQKKLVLLMSDYLSEVLPYFLVIARSIVEACGVTLIAMDNENDIHIPEEIDLTKYNDFKYKYLTSQKSENQLSVDIFINFIKKNHRVT